MTRADLEGKSRSELFAVCREMGLASSPADTNENLINRLTGEEPERKKQADKPLVPEGQLLTLDGKKINGKKFRVTIFSTETEKGDVFMGVNGFGIQMRRNVEYILDECFLNECLGHSMIHTMEQDPDTQTAKPVSRMAFPHQAIPV